MDAKNTALLSGLPQPQWLCTSLFPWFYCINGCCVSAIIPLPKCPLKAHHPLLLLLFVACHYNSYSLVWSSISGGQTLFEIVTKLESRATHILVF